MLGKMRTIKTLPFRLRTESRLTHSMEMISVFATKFIGEIAKNNTQIIQIMFNTFKSCFMQKLSNGTLAITYHP